MSGGKPGRLAVARLARIRDAGRRFDIEFWQAQSAEARFAAAWEMVCQRHAMRGSDERQPRLQRSVQRILFLRRDVNRLRPRPRRCVLRRTAST